MFEKFFGILTLITFCNIVVSFAQNERLKVYIDCRCDMNFLRQELSYVNHVRDQAMADVQLFVNDIGSGNGARSYDLNFIGKNSLADIKKELNFTTSPTMTSDEVRTGLAEKIALGLLPYLLESGGADQLKITISSQNTSKQEEVISDDPWNNWIFEVHGEGGLDKESSRSSTRGKFGFESDRVTEDWRVRMDMQFNHSESRFEGTDEEEYTSVRQRHYAYGSIVRSLSDHWSAGIFSGVRHDTYRNLDLSYHLSPAIEYNLFPYSEVIRREITFAYKVGYVRNDYLEATIYDRMEEDLFNQSLSIAMRFRQPWGDLSTNIAASAFLHDFSKNSVNMNSHIAVRVFKGLALRFSANMEIVKDQLNLPAGDASIEDILLRQRQIATDFEMGVGMGVSYTFGSAFNNVVNTRL